MRFYIFPELDKTNDLIHQCNVFADRKIVIYIIPELEKVLEKVHLANVQVYHIWIITTLFTWKWWLLLAIGVVSWLSWIYMRPKDKTHHLLLAGFFVMVATYFMDAVGLALGLWSYPIKEIPLIPPYLVWDLCVMPVSAMATIQFKPTMNQIVKSIGLGLSGAFIVQPIASWLGYYHLKHWRHSYSFPLVIIIYLLANFFYNERSWKKH
ncbi:CBO0543 family protein [Desulfosporosinus sp. FKB]|uniref:CBO0543 family protein n=1 Tax=Desulfosporosinus sp. FKB TaxID=1969835 RepID=UPI000B4A4340|nr:CBO0543 family protein [Desulfosporosinus sp. FKB]